MAFKYYGSFCKCAKRGRKIRGGGGGGTKKLSQFLKSHISGMLEVILLKFGMWSTEVAGMTTAKIVLFHQGSIELRRCENCVYVLPVNIHTSVARRLLGPHDTTMCLDSWPVLLLMVNNFRLGLCSNVFETSRAHNM